MRIWRSFVTLAFILLVAAACCGDEVSWRRPALVYGLGAAADAASTQVGLSRPGTHEANLLMGGLRGRAVLFTATAAGQVYLDVRLQRAGRRRLARGLRVVMTLGRVALVVHNVRAGR
jgi:hypothetical protein